MAEGREDTVAEEIRCRRLLEATQDRALLGLLELVQQLQRVDISLAIFRQMLSFYQKQENQNHYDILVPVVVRTMDDYLKEFLTTGQYTRVLQLQGRVSGVPPKAEFTYLVVFELVKKMIEVEEEIRKVRVHLTQNHGIEYDGLPELIRHPVCQGESRRNLFVLILNNAYFDNRRKKLMDYVNRVYKTRFYLSIIDDIKPLIFKIVEQ